MRQRIAMLAITAAVVYGCASSTPPPPRASEILRGIASWYGEEFAGRTTANGEIFDPLLLTAAHRTLPFGTILDVLNPKTSQTVRVRVNDRGPYIGNRIIDLSYAAAQQIGLIEPGIGDVEVHIVQLGRGEREPPAPFAVTVAEAPKTAPQPAAGDPPPIAFPIPATPGAPAVVDRVEVVEQRDGIVTRKQVGDDGKTIIGAPIATRAPAAEAAASTPRRRTGQFVVQVGAFSVEENARALQQRLARIGQQAIVDGTDLWRVRIGPFATRDEALKARATLEANGISAIIVSE
jgi:rare lipoprotein A